MKTTLDTSEFLLFIITKAIFLFKRDLYLICINNNIIIFIYIIKILLDNNFNQALIIPVLNIIFIFIILFNIIYSLFI